MVGRQQDVPQGTQGRAWFFPARTAFRGVGLEGRVGSGKGRKATGDGKSTLKSRLARRVLARKKRATPRLEGDLGLAEIGVYWVEGPAPFDTRVRTHLATLQAAGHSFAVSEFTRLER